MCPRRTRWGIAIAAGLVWLLPATAARAQFGYGYDSFLYGSPPPQTFWAGAGFDSQYTDPSTGVFFNGEIASPRTVAPYAYPPYGAFQRGNGLPAVNRPFVMAPAPVRPAAVRRRRGLIRRPPVDMENLKGQVKK